MNNFNQVKLSTISSLELVDNKNYLLMFDKNDTNYQLEVNSLPRSKNTIIILDQGSNNTLNLVHEVDKDANSTYYVISINNGINKYNIDINLNKAGSECQFDLIACGVNTKLDVNVTLNNNDKNTSGNIWMRGVVNNGSLIFNPVGRIKKGCSQASNYQESRILLLNDNTKSEVNPILLIDHYDVLAGHAASVAQLDEQTLFYLLSRGISRSESQALMMMGFVQPLLDKLPQELNDELSEVIANSLNIK